MIRVIVNCNARAMQDEAARTTLTESVQRAVPDAQVWFTDDSTTVDDLVKRALADGATTLVGGGGDGTINAVASAVVGTDLVLGVLPLGTLNHFAKDLTVPADIDNAVLLLRDGVVSEVDVGEVNGRIFLNNSGLGLYPDIVHQREIRQKHGASKWPAAFASALRALTRYRVLGIRLTVDGKTMLRRTPAVLVGNNEYTTEGGLAAKRLALDEGMLSLYLPRRGGRVKLIWFSLRALIGNSRRVNTFEVLLSDAFTIESRHAGLRVSLDGEVTLLSTPLEYRCRAKALRVLVPTLVR